ncbi:MAG TPA: SpoIVB peptidase S55 domain-containing protein [Thermoanaerobaculia bacterium]|nr:SpoIVB peptidase S55 domain-containing protein [Thermoanaerobaculia bacterium]
MLKPLRAGFALAVPAIVALALAAGGAAFAATVPPAPAGPPKPAAPAVPALAAPDVAPDVMPLAQIQRGQKGYGVSVFAGTALERFDVEVLGVIHDLSPNVSYVLARLSGRGLEDSGVIAGMSGSPVYIDGKLVGAVAFSWPFAKEAIAGITPIEAMRQLRGGAPPPLSVPTGGGGPPPAVPTAAMATTRDLEALIPKKPAAGVAVPPSSRDTLAAALGKLRPMLGGQAAGAVAWSTTGFAPLTQELVAQGLGAVAPSGQAQPGTVPTDLEPGAAVAAVLVDGDLRLAATGTVTDRTDAGVLAFGHPFLGLGPVDIPMAGAEVVAVVANQYSSFKIANFGPTVGAFHQDRLAGIYGEVGAQAALLPLEVHVDSGRSTDYHLRLARVPQVTPALLGLSVLGAQEAAAQSTGPLGVDLEATFDLGDKGVIKVNQSFDGDSAPTDAAVHMLTFGNFFFNNGFAQVDLRKVDVRLTQHPTPRTAALVGGYADRTELHPGEQVKLHLDLVPWRGEPVRRDLTLSLPKDLPAGRYSVLVGDGVTLDAVRLSLEPASPVRLDQALELVRAFHSRRDLVALGVYSGEGLSVAGEVLPRLPGSLRSVWSAASSQSAVALPLTLAQQQSERVPFPVDGAVRIDLNVVRRTPMTGEGAGATTDEPGAEPAAAGEAPVVVDGGEVTVVDGGEGGSGR